MISAVMAAIVVIAAVPVVIMLGCTMNMSMSTGCSHTIGMVVSGACGGVQVLTQQLTALVASGFSAVLFALLAVFMMAVLLLAPTARSRAFVLASANPPPTPEDPLGVRLRL